MSPSRTAPRKGRPAGQPGFHKRAYAVLLAYDGTPYKGWAYDPKLATVSGVLGAALRRAGVAATPFGASRTDAGVHARAQVASFSTAASLDLDALARALRADLPETIRLLALRETSTGFHAHWSSTGKVYRYRVSFCGEPRAWRLPAERFPYTSLDARRLARALRLLCEAPDVSALAARREHAPPTRRLERAQVIEADARGATVEVQARGFGKYLVRGLVSAAVGFSVGAYDEADLARMLSREAPPPPRAPADGLVLRRVLYPADVDPFPDLDVLAGP